MSTTVRAMIRSTIAAGLICTGAAVLGGCGWTPRDEYLFRERSAISARPGDGTTLTSEWSAQRGRQLEPAEVAARFGAPD